MNDLRFAFRQLLKNPGFTAVAVLTLALGIGASTAIFSFVNEILLRTLPVKNPGELILFRTVEGKGGHMSHAGEDNGFVDPASGRWSSTSFSMLIFERFRAYHPALSDVFAYAPLSDTHLLIDGRADAGIQGQYVSGNYYTGLGVPAILGRTITIEDDRPSAEAVVVISYRYWRDRFGLDRGAIGKVIQLNKVPATIIGVTPLGFAGAMQIGESADITVPLAHHAQFQPGAGELRAQPWYWWIRIMGRRAPQATPARAVVSFEKTFQETAREGWLAGLALNPESSREMPGAPKLTAEPGGQGENDKRREYKRSLHILMGLVSLVLAAACGNVANLLLARGTARRREVGLRFALGASRARVICQLLIESLVLAFLGAMLGILLSYWSRGLLLALRPWAGSQAVLDLPLDGRVLGFTVIAAVASALLFGLAPALRATRFDLSAEFQGGSRQLGAGRHSRLSQFVMVVQIALSLVMLVGAGLFVRTLRNLQNVDPGFNRNQLILFRIDAASAGYSDQQLTALQKRLQQRLEGIPGVRAATFSHIALLDADRENRSVSMPGYTPAPGESMDFDLNGLAPNFFDAMGIPVVAGRGFEERDDATAPKVAVVNQTMARKLFGASNPVGRRFSFGAANAGQVEIVGVVRDAKYGWLRQPAPPTIYVPAAQDLRGAVNYCVRAIASPGAIMPAVRAAVRDMDPTLPVINLRTQAEQMARLNWQELLFARLSGFFGVVALALASVGLYGLVSYRVARRTGEIGLRMALGAMPAQVLGMILRESLTLVALGLGVGLMAAISASRLIESTLFGLSATDPLTYGAVALGLVVVALAATLLPARRAAKVDPMAALRCE